MKNKELLLRRMQTLEGKLKQIRLAMSENDNYKAKKILEETLELRQDINKSKIIGQYFLIILKFILQVIVKKNY